MMHPSPAVSVRDDEYTVWIIKYGHRTAPRRELFYRHHHPYTEGLLRSLPTAGRRGRLTPIGGTPPSLITPPPGCPFAPRCPERQSICVLA